MSTWQDAEGRWHAEACIPPRRRLHRRCPKGASESYAKLLEAELVRALHSAAPEAQGARRKTYPGNPLLTDLLAYYHDIHAPTLRSDTGRYHALRIAAWCEGKRASDTRAVAKAIKKDLAPVYAPGTINRSLGVLRKALHDAWTDEDHPHRVAVDYSGLVAAVPDEHRARKVTLSLEDVKRIADCASANVRAGIWCCLFTGCRRGEILKAKREDIGDDTLRVLAGNTKTLRYREVPIVAAARPWLAKLPLPIGFEGVKSGWQRAARQGRDAARPVPRPPPLVRHAAAAGRHANGCGQPDPRPHQHRGDGEALRIHGRQAEAASNAARVQGGKWWAIGVLGPPYLRSVNAPLYR